MSLNTLLVSAVYTALFISSVLVCFGQNQTDENGLRQGRWWFAEPDISRYRSLADLLVNPDSPGRADTQYVSIFTGFYVDGMKSGVWRSHLGEASNYSVKTSEISFVNDSVEGLVKIYHSNGVVQYEGDFPKGADNFRVKEYTNTGFLLGTKRIMLWELLKNYSRIDKEN